MARPVSQLGDLWTDNLFLKLVKRSCECEICPEVTLCRWQDGEIQELTNLLCLESKSIKMDVNNFLFLLLRVRCLITCVSNEGKNVTFVFLSFLSLQPLFWRNAVPHLFARTAMDNVCYRWKLWTLPLCFQAPRLCSRCYHWMLLASLFARTAVSYTHLTLPTKLSV